MKPYGNQFYLKKKVSSQNQKSSEKISLLNIKLTSQIFNIINISLLVLIFILFFLSFDSQRKWSYTYKILSKTKVMNNNLIDYISKTEEFYINELESRNSFRKTKPTDLIYLKKITENKESFFNKNINNLINGINESIYQKGY